MAIGQVAVSLKTKNRRMPLNPLKTRAFRHTPDETPPYFGGIDCIKDGSFIDLASHYGGQLTKKIELIKRAVFESRVIEFDYFCDKGEPHRRVEPYFIVFQWSSWYVFGFCLERQDWRMFKLLRLWNQSAL